LITDQLADIIRAAVDEARAAGELAIGDEEVAVQLEPPKNREFGDYATNVAMILQKRAGLPGREVAARILKRLPVGDGLIQKVDVAGPGFMNLTLKPDWLHDTLVAIETQDAAYGTNQTRQGERTLVEFVSANPTGPISVVNGRAAALGDSLANLLAASGAEVQREFYVNDALNSTQINLMGLSLGMRYLQQRGHIVDFPRKPEGQEEAEAVHEGVTCTCGRQHPFPTNGYHGEYLVEIAREIADEEGDAYTALSEEDLATTFRDFAAKKMIEQQKRDLAAFGVEFDTWFFESSLYERGEVRDGIRRMTEQGHTYEKDGALWLKTTALSKDEQDRVLVRSNDRETYIAADAAYHKNKFERGFNRLIDIWGADHHGYVQRLKASVAALGHDPARCEIVLTQMVLLMRDGELVRGSKRAGDVIPLADLVAEVGKDAARFYCLMSSYETTATFDLDLAKKQSSDNPVFYAQYAHARCANVLAQAAARGVTVRPAAELDRSVLTHEKELDLLRKLGAYPGEVKQAGGFIAPHRLTAFVREIGQALHQFYEECPALKEGVDPAVRDARLALFNATRIVVRNLLALLGVSAPDKM
jgi:arginyl-tRNA synthetase